VDLAFTTKVSVRGGRPVILVPEEQAGSLAPGLVAVELRAGDLKIRYRGRVARMDGKTYIALPKTALALRGAYVVASIKDPDG
jgi:hypothetical protein